MKAKIEKKENVLFAQIAKRESSRVQEPLFRMSPKFSKTQLIQECDYCMDTSFELLVDKVPTGRCCRCGKPWPKK